MAKKVYEETGGLTNKAVSAYRKLFYIFFSVFSLYLAYILWKTL
ncbi:MAG: hypothetical protein N2647_02810 [Thermodesulfovibrio sp.]|nr:hypothetical protein [Thermodesulfovibrio sp.]